MRFYQRHPACDCHRTESKQPQSPFHRRNFHRNLWISPSAVFPCREDIQPCKRTGSEETFDGRHHQLYAITPRRDKIHRTDPYPPAWRPQPATATGNRPQTGIQPYRSERWDETYWWIQARSRRRSLSAGRPYGSSRHQRCYQPPHRLCRNSHVRRRRNLYATLLPAGRNNTTVLLQHKVRSRRYHFWRTQWPDVFIQLPDRCLPHLWGLRQSYRYRWAFGGSRPFFICLWRSDRMLARWKNGRMERRADPQCGEIRLPDFHSLLWTDGQTAPVALGRKPIFPRY